MTETQIGWLQRLRARLRERQCVIGWHALVLTNDGASYQIACEHCGQPARTPVPVGIVGERGPIWHVGVNNLTTFLATDRIKCTRVWTGTYCPGQGKNLEYLSTNEVLVRCDKCNRVIARVEFQTQ